MVPPWFLVIAGLYAGAAAVRDGFAEQWTRGGVYALLSIIILFFAVRNQRAINASKDERDGEAPRRPSGRRLDK